MEQLSHSTGSVSLTRFLTPPRMLVIRTTGVLLHESCGSYGCGRRNLTLSVKNQPEERPRLQHRLPQCQNLPRRSRWYILFILQILTQLNQFPIHFLIIFAALSISVTYNLDTIPLKPVIQFHLSRHSIVIAFNISKLHDFCCHLLWIHRLIQVRIESLLQILKPIRFDWLAQVEQ